MDNLTNRDYSQMVKASSPPTKSYINILAAFAVGGLICAGGHGLFKLYEGMGQSKETAFSAMSISLVFLAALLTGLNVYDKIAKRAGGGALVPITGFSNAMTAAALEYKSEGYIMGIGAKLFSIAGPVIVYGIAAGIVYGVILYLFKLY